MAKTSVRPPLDKHPGTFPWRTGITYLLLTIYGLFIAIPVVVTIASSIRPSPEIFKYMMPFSWKTILPQQVTFSAYIDLFTTYNFGRVLFNSIFVSTMTVALGVITNSMAGFAFAAFRFRGRDLLFAVVLISFMVPFESIAIPLYQLINQIGLVNTYSGLILPGAANGLVVFLFRQFFLGLPTSLYDSARVDGASWFVIFIRIVLPISKPAIISASILTFIVQWSSFFYPLLAANRPQYRVIQVAIANFFTQYQTLWSLLFAAVVMATIIPLLLILPLQQFYVQAIAGTGIKE